MCSPLPLTFYCRWDTLPNATRASKAAEKPVRMLLRHDLDHREGLVVARVPAVAVDGTLADCCQAGVIDVDALRALGIGSPA